MTKPLIHVLADIAASTDPQARVEVLETHMSWVLLAGDFAYKVKKPVVLPFADFGTLAARHHFCLEELRLNRRLAAQLYLDVVPITGTSEAPRIGGSGPALEYAVKMRRFEQDALFDHRLARDELPPELLDCLAKRIAAFHARAPATTDAEYGTPGSVMRPALDNFAELVPHAAAERRAKLEALAGWTRRAGARLEPVFAARHRDGWIRECHGDLHLRNVALIDGRPVAFDCIEFSAALRWIDIVNEAAFLIMDLLDRARADLAYRFLDTYLAQTGDYAGVAVLRFYLAYRALVRAKVHDLRARQMDADPHAAARLQAATDHYVELAGDIVRGTGPALILMHGFSGAGKSRVATALTGALGAIRLRSDIERKRLFGLAADARSHSAVDTGIYDRAASERTYARLAELAETVLNAGYPVILDAAFLARTQREPLYDLAGKLRVPIRIVDCNADFATLRERVATRAARRDDASEATLEVLRHQLAVAEPLTAAEQTSCVRCSMQGPEVDTVARCVDAVVRHLDRGQGAAGEPGS